MEFADKIYGFLSYFDCECGLEYVCIFHEVKSKCLIINGIGKSLSLAETGINIFLCLCQRM